MNQNLALVAPAHSERYPAQAKLAQRLMFGRGELYRVPAYYQLLRIQAGTAYVTQAGQDYILHSGQELCLERAEDVALVSGLGSEPVILELFSQEKAQLLASESRMDTPNFPAHGLRRGLNEVEFRDTRA